MNLMVLQWVALGVISHPLHIGRVSKAIVDYFSWGGRGGALGTSRFAGQPIGPRAAQPPRSSAKAARTASTSGMTSGSGSCRILR